MTMSHPVISPKKLIEVALPLDAINDASVRESYIYRGNPSALHKWWAQRPLAAARAVIFAQLVHDPEDLWRCQNPGQEPNPQVRGHWTKSRARLFKIIEDLVVWENTTKDSVLKPAREEVRKAWRDICELNKNHPQAKDLFNPEKPPALHDPFAGGGTIPLEAQRLGLFASASDLNPVAVLINKAMIDIPPRFAGRPAVHPDAKNPLRTWMGTAGLAEDVRRYGAWMRDEASKRIGHLYPKVQITRDMVKERPDLNPYEGGELNVIAWLWARTVKSPNPAFSHVDVPLAGTFLLSSKSGKECYVQPVIDKEGYSFSVKVGKPPAAAKSGTKASRGNFRCLLSGAPIDARYLMAAGQAGRLGGRLMAVVAEGNRGRVYLSPSGLEDPTTRDVTPEWSPDSEFFQQALGFRVGNYGMTKWSDLFSARQLVAMNTFADLVTLVRDRVVSDSLAAAVPEDDRSLAQGGRGSRAYADAVATYLAFSLSKVADYNCTLVPWYTKEDRPSHLFSRQAIPMVWDYAEMNPLSEVGGSLQASITIVADALRGCDAEGIPGLVEQQNALDVKFPRPAIVSTDPPYYDNIGYADLSDFFYVWLRRALKPVFPELFSTLVTPKSEELVATPGRHGGPDEAERFFLDGMVRAMQRLSSQVHPAYPITLYYAFKQSESDADDGTASTGWETFLEAVMRSGLAIHGTWPMRTERGSRSRGIGSNALASSIVLVCRQRTNDVGTISRRQFVRMLNESLPLALDAMTRESEGVHSPVAPVDLSQAIIGPGMAIFSRYDAVLEADGTPMTVRTALQLINRFLAEDDFDADTQFCLHWFEQHGWETGKFGEADTLARAKGTSVEGVKQSGVVFASAGQVRLVRPADYSDDWNPDEDSRLPIWEALHQLIRAFRKGGESGAGAVYAAVLEKAEAARQLAYRLYTLCERAGLAEDARAYNELITSWTAIESAAAREPNAAQQTLFDK